MVYGHHRLSGRTDTGEDLTSHGHILRVSAQTGLAFDLDTRTALMPYAQWTSRRQDTGDSADQCPRCAGMTPVCKR